MSNIKLEAFEKFLTENPEDIETAFQYAVYLFNMTASQNLEELETTIEKLKNLYEKYDSKEIALQYIAGLLNLATKQDLESKEKTVEILKYLYAKYDDEEICFSYARLLCSLTMKQHLTETKNIVAELEILYYRYASEKLAQLYALGLFSLILKQCISEKEKTVEKLNNLYKRHKNKEMALLYSMSLCNLGMGEDLEGNKKIIKILKKLNSEYKNSEIALQYAKGLENLASKGDLEEIVKIVKILKGLKNQYKNEEILFQYVMALCRLITKQDLEEMEKTLKILEDLSLECNVEEVSFFCTDVICRILEIILNEPDYDQLRFIKKFRFSLLNTDYYPLINLVDNYSGEVLENIFKIHTATKKIMNELAVKNTEVISLGHYTKLDTIPCLIKSKEKGISNLRLNNASYMNDPSEGHILLEFLRKKSDNTFLKEVIDLVETGNGNEYSASSVYLFSLTSSIDKLPMWSQYGDDGKGCCLILDNNFFDCVENEFFHDIKGREKIFEKIEEYSERKNKGLKDNLDENISIKGDNIKENNIKETFCPYNICYMNLNETNIENSKVEKLLDEIWKTIESFKSIELDINQKKKLKKDIAECLEQIRFLFKSIDYQHEQESRLLKLVPLNMPQMTEIELNYEKSPVPWLYIERKDKPLIFKNVILGPKVENPGYIGPYINYCDSNISVKKSEIQYR